MHMLPSYDVQKELVQCNKTKLTKPFPDVLEKVFSADLSNISIDGREWMCKTCDRSVPCHLLM